MILSFLLIAALPRENNVRDHCKFAWERKLDKMKYLCELQFSHLILTFYKDYEQLSCAVPASS